MAKRKAIPLLALAGVFVVGALTYGVISDSSGSVPTADPGGGAVPAPSGPPAPYAISTLSPVGTAAQDPGGGGGGSGPPGFVGPPGIQGAQGPGSAQGPGAVDPHLYLSGVNLLDPQRSAVSSGENTFPSPATTIGGILGPVAGGTDTSGCATTANSTDYFAVPLRIETSGFSGTPQVHLRISGGCGVQVTLFQQSPGGACQPVTSGSGTIYGGVANVTLGARQNFTFSKQFTPSLVVTTTGAGQHTISTTSADPSFIFLPGLFLRTT